MTRKFALAAGMAALLVATAGCSQVAPGFGRMESYAQAAPAQEYGPGPGYGPGYGPGPGMMGGWGYGPGYDPERGWGPGMMGGYGPGYGPGMMWAGGGWFHMLFGFLMMLLFLAVIVVLVVLGVRRLGGFEHSPLRPGPGTGQRTALEILKERLARGEIEIAEYEDRKRALGE